VNELRQPDSQLFITGRNAEQRYLFYHDVERKEVISTEKKVQIDRN
jgi:hypothetical protein